MPIQSFKMFALFVLGLTGSLISYAQEAVETGDGIPVNIVETLPAWKGCPSGTEVAPEHVRRCTEQAIANFVVSNLMYPKKARRKGIEGRVIVKFIVERDGEVSDVKVVKGAHPMLDDEAQRVVESMPAFLPGMQRGKPVRVSYHLPFNFSLK